MQLSSISLNNFRCLKEVNNIPIHKLTILLGENDAGKSSILDALKNALNKKSPQLDDYYTCEGQPSENEIVIELLFTFKDGEETPDRIFLNRDNQLQYRVKFTQSSILFEVKGLKYRNPILNTDFNKLKATEFDEVLAALGITHEGRLNSERRMQLLQQHIEIDKPDLIEEWVQVRNEFDRYLPRFEKYSTADYKNPESMILKTLISVVESHIYEVSESGKKLIKPLDTVKKDITIKLNTKISELLGFVRSYNPNVNGLEIDPIIDFVKGFQTGKLYLKDILGNTYHIENKGEGTKKRLFMSILDWDRKVMLENDNRPVIRGYDEPDAHLHYEAQRKMYYCLRDITHEEDSKIQAIICTHSLTLIDRSPAKSINLLRLDEQGKCFIQFLNTNNDASIEDFLSI